MHFLKRFRLEATILLILALGILLLYLGPVGGDKGHRLELIRDLEVYHPPGGTTYDETWFDRRCKVVVYMHTPFEIGFVEWERYISQNPDVAFIFYYGGDLSLLKEKVAETHFDHPILIDSDLQFVAANKGAFSSHYTISFFLVGEEVHVSNPSLPNFRVLLDRCAAN